MAKTQSDGDETDAIDMLMEDHKRVQKLFKEFEKIARDDEETLRDIVETACVELQLHSLLEEELFYPAVRAHVDEGDDETESLLNEAEVEHESVDELIAKLHELEPDDAMYRAYFGVLSAYVKHHVREEEKELFPEVKKMSALDLQQLARDMRLRREELFAEIEEGAADAQSEATAEPASGTALDPVDSEEVEDEQERIDISRTRH